VKHISQIQTNIDKFEIYYNRIVETNEFLNLTAITERQEVFVKHFEDSLMLASAIPDIENNEYSLIDVGTGAGFPGLPMAIAYPNIKVTLTDSLKKRLNFLQGLVDELGLQNVEIVHSRVEDLGHDENYREKFDIATCRAVSKLSTIVEYCTPLIHINGLFIPLKSSDFVNEVSEAKHAMSVLSCKINEIKEYKLSSDMGARSLIVIQKFSTTPNKYPRKAGTPSKSPL